MKTSEIVMELPPVPTSESIVLDLGYEDVQKPHLLAFLACVDDRPLWVDCALLAIELSNGQWRLTHGWRHPKDERHGTKQWQEMAALDIDVIGHEDYDRKPTKDEVERFIRDSWFSFEPVDGFRLLYGEVFSDTWKAVLGFDSGHSIPKQKE